MSYFNVCSQCGAHLDPGERCDCYIESTYLREKFKKLVTQKENGQYQFNFEREERQAV